MAKPTLVVTSRYTKEIEDRIDRDYDARRNPGPFPFSQQKLLSAAEGADALFITPADWLDSEFFQKVSPTVKIIATYSVGFDHINVEAAARRKIAVANTPGVNHEATADIAMLLLLGASRRAYEAQQLVRTGVWKPLSPDMLLGWQVGGKILGMRARISAWSAARLRKPCRTEKNSEKMIANMALRTYSEGHRNSMESIRTEFLVGTSAHLACRTGEVANLAVTQGISHRGIHQSGHDSVASNPAISVLEGHGRRQAVYSSLAGGVRHICDAFRDTERGN